MIEFRSGPPVEVREDSGTVKVSGYAAVFNEETDIAGMFREVIKPGAFRNAVGRDDVVFLINHEGLPLARTRSGTLSIREDDKGLFMESELDTDDPDVKRLIPKMKRNDLNEMSFAFWADRQVWIEEEGKTDLRELHEVSLHDVSIVTTPQYEGTEIGLRSKKIFEARQKEKVFNHDVLKKRCEMSLSLRQKTGGPAH